jgi:hypothetical protein
MFGLEESTGLHLKPSGFLPIPDPPEGREKRLNNVTILVLSTKGIKK